MPDAYFLGFTESASQPVASLAIPIREDKQLEEPTLTIDDLPFASMLTPITSVPMKSILSERGELFERMRKCDPLKLAATFGGLLTEPELQSNCIRLEVLAHLAVALGDGPQETREEYITELFEALGESAYGMAEDPAEDVFVGLVTTPRGNFRILEGTWESAAFFLQRVLNAIEMMLSESGYDDLRESIYALLRLSDAVCERAGLSRYQLGNEIPESTLTADILHRRDALRQHICFSEAELDALGISLDVLAPFGFLPETRHGLTEDTLGHSALERCPVLYRNDVICLALPTAVSVAIRRFVVEEIESAGLREAFVAAVALDYGETFAGVPLLGSKIGAPIEFRRTTSGMIAGVTTRVEPGRFLNFVFLQDTLEDFNDGGLAGFTTSSPELEKDINIWIDHTYDAVRSTPDFRDGITLIVGCGIGRGMALGFEHVERPGWRIEFISAPDLYTLSWTDDFKPLSLWRLFAALDKLQSMGVALQNANGLLNMVAWAKMLDGHLIPHAHLPDDFLAEHAHTFISIDQNGLRKVRREVATSWDPHAERDIENRWVRVRRDSRSKIKEDRERPLYVSEGNSRPRAVYVSAARSWWCEVVVSEQTPGQYIYQRWQMATTWLSQSVPVLEKEFPELPEGPLLWRAIFEGTVGEINAEAEHLSYADAQADLKASTADGNIITTIGGQHFERANFHEDNIAERALVEALVKAVSTLAGRALEDHELASMVAAIVPDNLARQTHMFRTQHFRDYVQPSLPRRPIFVDELDVGTIKLGLGWQARNPRDGSLVQGKVECLTYLSSLVKRLEDELCGDIHQFDRLKTIRMLMRNHEAAVVDRERWSRTAAAVLSLHKDKTGAMETITHHEFELNSVFQATRLLSEIVICECPLSGGVAPAESDLSRLMAKMMSIQQLGSWSDSIRWDVMEPYLKIRPLGDIHAKLDFDHDIVGPFARTTAEMRVNEAIEGYASNLAKPEARRKVEEVVEAPFLAAWKEETGASLEEMLLFVDYLEDMGIREGQAVLSVPRSKLLNVEIGGKSLSQDANRTIVDFLTLQSRPKWRIVPQGYEDSDRQPWRFRRRLSVLRRPLLQINDSDDPTIVVAPGMLADAFTYMFGNYYRGDFPGRQLRRAMRSWAGTLRDRTGNEFSRKVAQRLTDLGWKTQPELKVTQLLQRGFERDYGDVDVLAWNPEKGRVLIVECKDVQYRKTYGEIAEQLSDFRGDIGPDGKRDYLRRHLDRVALIHEHLPVVAKFVGLPELTTVESHLIFKNPVPMQFALKHMAQQVSVSTYEELDRL